MIKNYLKQVLRDSDGDYSSKRLAGFVCFFSGLLTKAVTFLAGLLALIEFSWFDKLDTSANNLIYTGCALLGGTVFEKFAKNRNDK